MLNSGNTGRTLDIPPSAVAGSPAADGPRAVGGNHIGDRPAPLVVAFGSLGGTEWVGGDVFLENLLTAVRQTFGDEVSLCPLRIVGGSDDVRDEADPRRKAILCPRPRRWTPVWFFDRLSKRLFDRDVVGDFYLRRQGVRAIALGCVLHRSRVPALPVIYDFQHVHLPDLFSATERHRRDRDHRQIGRLASRVFVIGESVRQDFVSQFPEYAFKARRLDIACWMPPSVYEGRPEAVCERYHLPRQFVYLPNQFWKHKNHETVFRALRILKDRGVEVALVCSGFPGDWRHPGHFAHLLQMLSVWNIRAQVTFLGLLPREHVFALMRQSVCVLNPSLFEGYGMSVDEARSLGKQVLVSDIPAHREQDPPGAVYFNPADSEELAAKLQRLWLEKNPGPDLEREEEARRQLPGRVAAYAQSFMTAVREVVG